MRNSARKLGKAAILKRGRKKVYADSYDAEQNLNTDQGDHNLLETLRVSTGDRFLEQLEHVLKNVDTAIEDLETLVRFQICSGGVVQRF